MIKILLLTDQYFPTEESFTEEIFSKILPERNFEVTILARTREYKKTTTIKFNKAKMILFPCRVKYLSDIIKIPKLKNIIDENYDLIQVRNDPIYALISLKYKPVFYLAHLKGEELIIRWKESPKNILWGIIDLICRKLILKKAKLVLTISPKMNEYIKNKYNMNNVKALSMGISKNSIYNKEVINSIKQKYDLNNQIIFLYIGTMNRFRQLNVVIDAFKIANDQINIALIILGSSLNKNDEITLKHKVKRENIKCIHFIEKVPRAEVPNYIKASNIGLSVIPVNKVYYYASPTKTLEYLNEGVPVLATRIPFQEEILQKSKSGILCSFNKEDIAENMVKMAAMDKIKLVEMGSRGQKYVQEKFSYDKKADDLINSYMSIIKNKSC